MDKQQKNDKRSGTMFSLLRTLLVSTVVCLASTGWSLPQFIKTCSPDKKFSAEFKQVDKTLAINLSMIDQNGVTKNSSGLVNITDEIPFSVSMIKPDNAANMALIAGIPSFTGGFRLELEANKLVTVLWILEFEPGQYSVVWIIDDEAAPMGLTTACK